MGGRVARIAMRGAAVLSGVVLIALTVGFIEFAADVGGVRDPAPPEPAEGIVVFTGGQDRIKDAIRLLADGFARRLLISGVHPETTAAALAAQAGDRSDLFGCCIDLGHSARDTIGNAEETALWARKQGFTSLIIVTSSYHMPRSLAETRRAMPEAQLDGYAIATSSVDFERWWQSPQAVSLLMFEYVKLLATRARQALERFGFEVNQGIERTRCRGI